jgi:hypothetical protein
MSPKSCRLRAVFVAWLLVSTTPLASGAERTEHFDREPDWDAQNHRAVVPAPRNVRQDFGYSQTMHAGGDSGEIGGFITPAAEPAYYAAKVPAASFEQPLSASGTFSSNEGGFHVLVGFFNSGTLNEWRTPNTIALRLNGRGDAIYAYVEYATSRWRAGGDSPKSFPMTRKSERGRLEPQGFSSNAVHRWSLNYDPRGNDGHGAITATIDGVTSVCHLAPRHRQDGASFDRFGLLTVMKSADSGGEVWMDDVTINGRREDFSKDPNWDGFQNRRTYTTSIVRPRFDFGFSPTQYAGGRRAGELGGVIFRGDCRYPERMAHYADRLEELTLDKPLKAAGKVSLRRGVSDSGVLIGFFDSRASTQANPSQDSGLPRGFFGISTDGPSRDGFYFSPTYRIGGDARGVATGETPPQIYPDGKPHDWTFDYTPSAEGQGEIVVTLDGQRVRLPVSAEHRAQQARFDLFGIITTWVDGNSQTIFFDDLVYTFRQD